MKTKPAETIGAFDAKTHLSALLDKVARGGVFLITKHGKPIARLSPVDTTTEAPSLDEVLAQAQRFRAGLKLRLQRSEIRELVEAGRR